MAGGGRSARGVYDVLDPRLLRALEHDGVAAVAAGEGFSLALTPAGTVHAWGRHASGRLGLPGWLSSSVDAPLRCRRAPSAAAPSARSPRAGATRSP